MEFRIVYNKSYDTIVSNLEQNYKIVKEIVDTLNVFEIYFENEVIYSHKDNFNKMKINNKLISNKINSFIESRNTIIPKSTENLDNIDLDEY
tara:strand:+ start:291 stop:566 length:276 start_codon:yes stop_codon:yes gene_type:complete